MTFAVHRSDEPTARERGEAFGRAHAPAIRHTIAVYERMFAETGVVAPGTSGSRTGRTRSSSGMAEGAGVPLPALLAVNARTEILAGAGPTECSVVGAGGLLAQNWDWHPDAVGVDRDLGRRDRLRLVRRRSARPGRWPRSGSTTPASASA